MREQRPKYPTRICGSSLGEYSEQRAQFALQSSALVRQLDPVAVEAPRGGMTEKSGVKGESESSILEGCARGEATALVAYEKALGHDMRPASRDVVQSQRLQIEEVRGRIAELLAHVKARPVFD